jgi:photosynthetic reaction center cytochrome c subunit
MKSRLFFLAASIAPIAVFSAQQQATEPKCEDVFKDIKVFKGVPASDLIPSMEFMSASLGYECSDCHDMKDMAADTRAKQTARHMVEMQRDINAKNFNNRLEVTCMTCHNGHERPTPAPVPTGTTLRHEDFETKLKPEDFFAKHIAAVGKPSGAIVRTGTLTSPNDATHKIETLPLEFIQADGGKFRLTSGDRKIGSDGTQVWWGPAAMGGEPANIFERMGRSWRGDLAFSGLNRPTVNGRDTIGKTKAAVIRASRPATTSTEDLYFDQNTGLLVRMVNIRRSSLGMVITTFDYSNYKAVGGAKVPMKVVMTFAGGQKWTMDFKSATVAPVDAAKFKVGG